MTVIRFVRSLGYANLRELKDNLKPRSESADVRGGNSGGIKNPVVDALIEQIIAAKDLATLQTTTQALDRVLLWNHYAIPTYYNDSAWIAYWNRFGHPARRPIYSVGFPASWWVEND